MDSKQKICKICNKRYANGKALGGHMRSHLAKLPLPLPPPKPNQPSVVSSTSPSLDELSQEFSSVVEDAILESENENENESESESRRRHVTRQRSKRRRRSETFSAEDAAFFLVKLSKDKWDKREVVGHNHEEELAKFKCQTCNKVFGSYQALGGHKANHKKMMKSEISDDDDEDNYESTDEEDGNEGRNNNYAVVDDHPIRTFECPFCFKVFGSGQALGGHKKVHFSNNLPISARISSRKFGNSLIIDLNLPAVADEEVE